MSTQKGSPHLQRIVSGGQTGVDRAALDAALENGIAAGGWCPAGRKAEDGLIPESYCLNETPSDRYDERTEWNVRDSDGTLILACRQPLSGGTEFTHQCATKMSKPVLVLNPSELAAADEGKRWLKERSIRVLNVAGPRESQSPGIYQLAKTFLSVLLKG